MEVPHPAGLTAPGDDVRASTLALPARERALAVPARAPALLVSLHDVSPLTLPECEGAVALLGEVGLAPDALTVLVIPCHEGRAPLDGHPPTVRFLRALADAGARLVMHGLTHRMPGRAWSPAGFFRGHLFARGEGELLLADAADVARRLEQGSEILGRAGLAEAARAFVPPAWLLSPAARDVVRGAGFEFYETFGGIVHAGRLRAPRVIGWGSLNAVEAVATAAFAWAQSHLSPVDTRLCVHPADMRRPRQRSAIRRAIARMLPRARAQSYTTYLAG